MIVFEICIPVRKYGISCFKEGRGRYNAYAMCTLGYYLARRRKVQTKIKTGSSFSFGFCSHNVVTTGLYGQ